ncbi:MAG TPA: hypothetical protein VFX70_03035 [Mycobacteriales bacterium]|nr:hypothetical protein [Mycobacteriales bacterium]
MTGFLDRMPEAVRPQRDLLERLLAVLGPDPTWRWLELSCSLARGAGDALSDVDCGVGARDDDWPGVLSTVEGMVRGLGDVVDLLHHELEGVPQSRWVHRHTFVQYADGTQLSLVVTPASSRRGLPPGAVALMDKDGRLAGPVAPATLHASERECREWAFYGWQALSDLDKYLRRGSLWEAHQRLEQARDRVWQLWAARHGAAYPCYGLTSVLDADLPPPGGIGDTVAGLHAGSLRAAALAVAALLGEFGTASDFGRYVACRLRTGPPNGRTALR